MQTTFSKPLLVWYRKNRRDLPWRRTRDPYAIFVSEIMLQQTQVKTVLPYYTRWMMRYPTIAALAKASEAEALKSWEGLGYYRRARFLHAAAKLIMAKFNGQFPKTLEAIGDLPGVGPYTMGAVGSIAFNLPVPILDGNVARVLSRWFGIKEVVSKTKTKKKLLAIAEQLISKRTAGDFNQSLMELGATLCTPQNPQCTVCPIQDGCWAFAHDKQEMLPKVAARQKMIKQFEYAGFIHRNGQILLYQRKLGERMENLWQFPSITLSRPSRNWDYSWKQTFGQFQKSEKLSRTCYSVTHHRIHLDFFKIHKFLSNGKLPKQTEWVDPLRAHQLPFTAAHRKLADRFLNVF